MPFGLAKDLPGTYIALFDVQTALVVTVSRDCQCIQGCILAEVPAVP